MILTAKSFLDERRGHVPSEAEVREALSGTLCRCTGYQKIVEAVIAAARQLNSWPEEARRAS
jgi:carbon-monoxide dehydrogenase small subunit